MQSILFENRQRRLDSANAGHVRAAEERLAQGDVEGACRELRKIQRAVAGTPAVIQLRRRLVGALLGFDGN